MPYTKEQAKEELKKLIEKFKQIKETKEFKEYTEEDTKKDFILPLFRTLNWNIENPNEVNAERRVATLKSDYRFKIDEIIKFFLEAKSVNEKITNEDIEQAINYSWLKPVTWAVLTNFEELRIYNADWKAKSIIDKQFIVLKIDEYLDKFDRLWLLSKDSFLNNEIDKFAEEVGKKEKKTFVTPVMKQIFNDLMTWREKLTKNISGYSSNKKIVKSEEELDEAVQRIIDRLIFIRVCEDRRIENITLQSKLREWQNSHKRDLIDMLNDVFREFDKGYNSRLFSPHLSENLKIDDVVLVDIISNLYESSDKVFKYDFSIIEADVLGNIYEEYLGYILQKSKKKASVIANHMHKKEMGIYYTPTFVVDYIVRNTLGEMLKQMKPKQINEIKVLDMACGSGSFLLKAFDTLNNWHKNKNELDFLRKVKILTTNIYGVDLDPKALEIAQLNLLLKTLERRRLLPKLQENLKVGNSLIEDSEFSERAFNWNKEFKGKFDIVIGNPPYIDYREIEGTEYFNKNYFSVKGSGKYNILILFIERGLELLKEDGKLGFIVSNQFLVSDFGKRIREFILNNCNIDRIIDVSNIKVFKNASTYPIIIILTKAKPNAKNLVELAVVENERKLLNGIKFSLIEQRFLEKLPNKVFITNLDKNKFDLIQKINQNSIKLKDVVDEFSWGTSVSGYAKKKIDKDKYKSLSNQEKSKYVKMIQTADIQRFKIDWQEEFVEKSVYTKNKLTSFEKEKLVIGRLNKFLKATFDKESYALGKSSMIILKNEYNPKFILGLLNSRLLDFYYKLLFTSTHMQGGYVRYDIPYLEILPVKVPLEKQQEEIVRFVDKILELNIELQKINPQSDKGLKLQEEINKIDRQIDHEVYKLYSLTKEEIKVIETS